MFRVFVFASALQSLSGWFSANYLFSPSVLYNASKLLVGLCQKEIVYYIRTCLSYEWIRLSNNILIWLFMLKNTYFQCLQKYPEFLETLDRKEGCNKTMHYYKNISMKAQISEITNEWKRLFSPMRSFSMIVIVMDIHYLNFYLIWPLMV